MRRKEILVGMLTERTIKFNLERDDKLVDLDFNNFMPLL